MAFIVSLLAFSRGWVVDRWFAMMSEGERKERGRDLYLYDEEEAKMISADLE